MSAFEAYKDYIALKNHFSSKNYDYMKYNGKTGVKHSSFDKRKDKFFFEKLAKRPDYHDFLVANLSEDHKLWIRDLAYSDTADKRFTDWKRRNQSLSYIFKSQTSEHLIKPFNDNFKCNDGQHPHLLKLYLGGDICLETFCILADLVNAIPYWDNKLEYDPVWEEIGLKVRKYKPFINYDKEKYKKIVLDLFD